MTEPEKFYVTLTRKEARALLDHLLTIDTDLVPESLTDTLDEAQGAAQNDTSHCVIIIEQGDL